MAILSIKSILKYLPNTVITLFCSCHGVFTWLSMFPIQLEEAFSLTRLLERSITSRFAGLLKILVDVALHFNQSLGGC